MKSGKTRGPDAARGGGRTDRFPPGPPGPPPEDWAIWLATVGFSRGFWLWVGESIELQNVGGELRVVWRRR